MTLHIDDGALVRWMDDECDRTERGTLVAHLETCSDCRGRLGTLRTRADRVRVLLQLTDTTRQGKGRRRPWPLHAVAASLLLLAGGLLVEPVRAWVVDRVVGAWAAVTGGASETSQPAAAPQAPALPRPEGGVSFVPTGDVFTLEVSARQRTGTLSVSLVQGETARAVVRGGAGDEALVVLPAGLRIENDTDSEADYLIELPAGLAAVRVLVRGEPPRVLDPGTGIAGWRLPLGKTGER